MIPSSHIYGHMIYSLSPLSNTIKGKGTKYSSTDGAYSPGGNGKAGKQSKGSKSIRL